MPNGLASLTQPQLDQWVQQAKAQIQGGTTPHYIPLLQKAEPYTFGVHIRSVTGTVYCAGETHHKFPLMSVIKPLLLLFLLEQLGAATIFEKVGMLPSDQAFNSLAQLEADRGWPRNPMINSGAIVLAGLLPGTSSLEQCEALRQWLNQQAGVKLFLDQAMLASVRLSGGQRNRELATFLHRCHHLPEPDRALDTYNQICCLSGTVADLSELGLLLTQPQPFIAAQHRCLVNALVATCGLYEASVPFLARVGLPTKSGVSGALLSIVVGAGAIACYGPALDEAGNSIAGLFLVEQLAQSLNLNLFG